MSIASFYIDYGIDPSDPNHLDSFLSGLAEGHTDGGWVYSAEHAGDDSDYDDSNSDNSYYGGGGSSSGHSDTHASSESLDRRAIFVRIANGNEAGKINTLIMPHLGYAQYPLLMFSVTSRSLSIK